jgi:hypothetical protein
VSVAFVGALAGLALALAELLFLRALSRRVDLPETKAALRVAGRAQLVLLPTAGWFAAPYLFGE